MPPKSKPILTHKRRQLILRRLFEKLAEELEKPNIEADMKDITNQLTLYEKLKSLLQELENTPIKKVSTRDNNQFRLELTKRLEGLVARGDLQKPLSQ